MGNAHHVGEGGGSVFPVALAEPFNDAEEAGSKFPGVGGDARDELGEAGQLVKGMELESPLEQWGVFTGGVGGMATGTVCERAVGGGGVGRSSACSV